MLAALFLSGCENGNNIHDTSEPAPPVDPTPVDPPPVTPPEETVLVESVSFSGQFAPHATVAINFQCTGCDMKATKFSWKVTKRSDPTYLRSSMQKTLDILEEEANAQITFTISPVDLDGNLQKDVVKMFDLEKGEGFDHAEFFHFGKDGYVIRLNDNIFMSSQNAETMSPKRVYLLNKDDSGTKDFAIGMPSLREPSGSFLRKELYEFPNQRWGIAINVNGESQELTDFEGDDYVLDCGDEYFTYKGTKVSRYDSANLSVATNTYEAGALTDVKAYCGHGVVFEKSDNKAVYFPKKGDSRPETSIEIFDMVPETFFTNQAFSGYLTSKGELKLLGQDLPPLAFSKHGIRKVYNNISATEITLEFEDGTFYRVGDFGAKFLEVVPAGTSTTVLGVNAQTPRAPADLNLVDFLYLSNGNILTSGESAEGRFYEPMTNKSCADWLNEAANDGTLKGVDLTAAAGNSAQLMMATDKNGYLYACHPDKASVNIDDKMTEQSISTSYTQMKHSKGTNEVYLLDQNNNTLMAYTVSVDALGKPAFTEYPLDNIDNSVDMLGFGEANQGSNLNVIRADGTQIILGPIAEKTGDKSIVFRGYEAWNHLNTLCSNSQCTSIHSNGAGDVGIAVINNANSVIRYTYEGILKAKEETTTSPQ
ncbi:hypothetical protein EA58_14425 [Photobacterium galatheae]|uniref:Uncharacterized protein n=2 Tax=Photobacterium galatheae TaxID=1654360 RepID=A0A066RTB3_9GAMM|nr:hypothetical protein EA58_14425 [Photobacterium galatheae]